MDLSPRGAGAAALERLACEREHAEKCRRPSEGERWLGKKARAILLSFRDGGSGVQKTREDRETLSAGDKGGKKALPAVAKNLARRRLLSNLLRQAGGN